MKHAFNTDFLLWLDIALDDIETARILYDKGKHRSSYFHFQQASEKANKAFAIMAGLLTAEELADIQHNQLKIYRKSLRKQEVKIQEIKTVVGKLPKGSEHPFLSEDILTTQSNAMNQGISHIDGLNNQNLKDLSLTELSAIIREIRKIDKIKIKLPKNIYPHIDKKFLELASWVGQFPTEEAQQAQQEYLDFVRNKEQSAEVYGYIDEVFKMAIKIGFVETVFFYCALLTIKHSSATRYPEVDTNPLKEYHPKMAIIKKQPAFMDLLEMAINRLKLIHDGKA
ncbi:MAG: HEPN domain-containing protein [Chitinophagaceae bacterium]|nr:MAG: HEPN domain-containing protein [Chitinophagaceae bacterium]